MESGTVFGCGRSSLSMQMRKTCWCLYRHTQHGGRSDSVCTTMSAMGTSFRSVERPPRRHGIDSDAPCRAQRLAPVIPLASQWLRRTSTTAVRQLEAARRWPHPLDHALGHPLGHPLSLYSLHFRHRTDTTSARSALVEQSQHNTRARIRFAQEQGATSTRRLGSKLRGRESGDNEKPRAARLAVPPFHACHTVASLPIVAHR